MIFKSVLDVIGNTPIVSIPNEKVNFYAKLEWYNPMGSIKDRAASYVLEKLIKSHEINQDTTIIESSSGNYGVALAAYCHFYGLSFIAVVDPLISPINEQLIRDLGAKVEKVEMLDSNGGYLLSRIARVKELKAIIPNSYWIDQYENPYTAESYMNTVSQELCRDFEKIDYVFIGVSSGGTITGLSNGLKQQFPNIKIIAVDIEGSVIFGGKPAKRSIPGIGSGRKPPILEYAKIDEVQMVNEIQTVEMCRTLLQEQCIFAGGSSGSVYAAVCQYFKDKQKCTPKPVVVGIFPDGGNRYSNTIYQ